MFTVSGFGLMIFTIASALDVNSPKEFGQKMTGLFGDRLRISKRDGKSYNTLTELFEDANNASKPRES